MPALWLVAAVGGICPVTTTCGCQLPRLSHDMPRRWGMKHDAPHLPVASLSTVCTTHKHTNTHTRMANDMPEGHSLPSWPAMRCTPAHAERTLPEPHLPAQDPAQPTLPQPRASGWVPKDVVRLLQVGGYVGGAGGSAASAPQGISGRRPRLVGASAAAVATALRGWQRARANAAAMHSVHACHAVILGASVSFPRDTHTHA